MALANEDLVSPLASIAIGTWCQRLYTGGITPLLINLLGPIMDQDRGLRPFIVDPMKQGEVLHVAMLYISLPQGLQ
jgi:hypothetical protein